MSDNEDRKGSDPLEEEKKQGDIDEDDVDESVFNQSNELIEDNVETEFQCINPQTHKGHVDYTCRGTDETGYWQENRRYSHFFKLHHVLEQRWPGVPIPILPPKKAIGNKEIKFINERRFYLERYLKKMSHFRFIVNSEEF